MHLQIENIRSDTSPRIDVHSHIKSLDAGFVGQQDARTASRIIVSLIKQKKLAGRSILFAGPSGSGKTALALAISKELGDVPFTTLVGSEIYSAEVKKSEILMESFRRAIGLRIKEDKEVFEGEVTKMNVAGAEGSGGEVVNRVNLTLETKKNEQELKLDGNVWQQLEQQNVKIGDIIYIEANSGLVKRVGRSDKYISDNELESDSYVPIPKGDEGDSPERDAARPGCSERAAEGWAGPGEHSEPVQQDEEDRDNREAAHRDRQGGAALRLVGRGGAQPRRAVRRRVPPARFGGVQLPEQSAGVGARAHLHVRHQPRGVRDTRHGHQGGARGAQRFAGQDADRQDPVVHRQGDVRDTGQAVRGRGRQDDGGRASEAGRDRHADLPQVRHAANQRGRGPGQGRRRRGGQRGEHR